MMGLYLFRQEPYLFVLSRLDGSETVGTRKEVLKAIRCATDWAYAER